MLRYEATIPEFGATDMACELVDTVRCLPVEVGVNRLKISNLTSFLKSVTILLTMSGGSAGGSAQLVMT